jgi:drug/metabolite transporter (DMT)-like permease
MIDEQTSEIRILLRSGELTDIGGPVPTELPSGDSLPDASLGVVSPVRPSAPTAKPSTTTPPAATRSSANPATTDTSTAGLFAAFAAVYLIWGSTYLAIRYAVETIPPLLMMGMRHLTAGALLYGWARWRGTPAPRPREWFYPAVIGALLFLGGHGGLAWAEQRVPSGIAALLVATLPMWIVVLARLWGAERKLSGRSLTGLVLGFVGVVVLFGPDIWRHNAGLDLIGAGAVLLGTFVWAAGTIYMRSVKMPDSPQLSSAMQMLAGGSALLVAASLTGEARTFHFADVSGRSWLAIVYLAAFGSIIAFTAYTWLHMVASPSRVSTYAYVNPVVAVLLGWALAAEPMRLPTVIAMVVILAGVALVNSGHKKQPPIPRRDLEGEAAAA